MLKNRRPSYLALLAASLIWGFSFIAAKFALQDIGPFLLTFLRFFIAVLLMIPLAYREGFRFSLIFRPFFLVCGLTGVLLEFGLQNLGLIYTTAGNAALIFASVPAITMFLSVIFLKEKLNIQMVLGVFLSILGVFLINLNNSAAAGRQYLLGNLLISAAVIAAAVYVVLIKSQINNYSSLLVTTGGFSSGVLFLLPFAIIETFSVQALHLSWTSILAVLFLGLGASALAFLLWNSGLKHIDAAAAAPFMNLTPVIGIFAAFLIGETFGWLQLCGGALTILGVWLSSLDLHRSNPFSL